MGPMIAEELERAEALHYWQVENILGLWTQSLLPAAQELEAALRDGRTLTKDGVQKKIPMKLPGLPFKDATRLAKAINEPDEPVPGPPAGQTLHFGNYWLAWESSLSGRRAKVLAVCPECGKHGKEMFRPQETAIALVNADEPDVRDALLRTLGQNFFHYLENEYRDARESLAGTSAEITRRLLLTGFVLLNSTLESLLQRVGKLLALDMKSQPGKDNITAYTIQIRNHLGIGKQHFAEERVITLMRQIANDEKHYGGLAHRSAVILHMPKGTPLKPSIDDLRRCASEVQIFGTRFVEAIQFVITAEDNAGQEDV